MQVKFDQSAPLTSSRVDAEKGIIRDVALISIGEAKGHEQRIDQKTLEMFYALVGGKTVKAFLNHTDNPKPTEAVGLYSGFYIDQKAGVLRASQFQAFKAFRENDPQAYQTLFEMADTAPDTFGISANFYHDLEQASDGGNPLSRPTLVESFDIVCTPAANKALFSVVDKVETQSQLVVDTDKKEVSEEVLNETQSQKIALSINSANQPTITIKMKAIYNAFKDRPEALARAVKFAAEAPDGTTEAQVVDAVKTELDAIDQAALIAERDALAAKVAELTAQVAALTGIADTAEEMKAKCSTLSANAEKQAALIAELSIGRSRYGVAPIKTGVAEVKEVKTITRAEFSILSPEAQNSHFRCGGKLSD